MRTVGLSGFLAATALWGSFPARGMQSGSFLPKQSGYSRDEPVEGAWEIEGEVAADTEASRRYLYAAQQKLVLDPKIFGEALAQVARERPEGLRFVDAGARYGNLMNYLAGSMSVHYTTPSKIPLRRWVQIQADNSVTPVALFRESLRLANGDVFAALLTLHELLRNEARFENHSGYLSGYRSTREIRNRFFNKLIDIRGDLIERGGHYGGDHGGTWYRIFGIFTQFAADVIRNGQVAPARLESTRWGLCATSVLAELVKPLLLWPERDVRKAEMNWRASQAAYHFFAALEHPERPLSSSSFADPSAYLRPAR
jgi:hypothetical protein